MNTFPILLGALCVYVIGYRFYSAFIAAKALALDDRRVTPAHAYEDGHNYVPSPKWVLFGHHFAAIAGAGPLVGPTLAAQFGFAPGFLWILIGAVLAGCVQDFMVLVASVRHKGRSLADVARTEVSPFTGLVAMFAVLLILLVTLAGLGIVVVNALSNSPWGVFTIGMTIPIAIFMGLYMFKSAPGQIKVMVPSVAGVVLLLLSVWGGHWFAGSPWASSLTFTPHQITYLMAMYGFVASVLPVWLLLEPRDYLSTYVKLGTIALLVIGVFIVHPDIKFPAVTEFVHGGGPIIKGKLFPFLFVTIACGAISGFHSLVSSGTTPKMLDKETDARFIGYGAMVAESAGGGAGADCGVLAVSGRLFRDQRAAGCVCQTGAAHGEPGPVLAHRWERSWRADGRSGVAGGGDGADLPGDAGDVAADGLLVSLRDHVRGAVHSDDD